MRRVFVRLDVLHRWFLFALDDAAILVGKKSNEVDLSMRIIDGHADLTCISLPQDIRKNERMLVNHAVLIGPPFHDAVRQLIEIELRDIVGQTPCGIANLPFSARGILMQDL